MVRDPAHKAALEHVVLAEFSTNPPCSEKGQSTTRGEGARAEAAKLLAGFEDDEVVVSLAAYQSIMRRMSARRDSRCAHE